MKKIKFNKIKIVVLIFVLIIITTLFYIIDFITNKPFDAVYKIRDFIDNKELIATEKTDKGIMVYSVGDTNEGNDKAYYVDMVEKSLIGYKWLGGGGHINRDSIKQRKDFVFSVQLLNEENNITPTICGIIRGYNFKRLKVETRDGDFIPTIYDGKEENEKFYCITFNNNVAVGTLFDFDIIYNGRKVKHMFTNEEVIELQKGHPFYIYDEVLE